MWPAEAPEAGPSDLLDLGRGASTETAASRALASRRRAPERQPGAGAGAAADVLPRTTVGAARKSAATNRRRDRGSRRLRRASRPTRRSRPGSTCSSSATASSLDDEVALKRRARDRGLLVMGPECGTAIINGVGLGFANRVRRGPIGVVGASGTGIQELTTLDPSARRRESPTRSAPGDATSHADVGGLTTLQARRGPGRRRRHAGRSSSSRSRRRRPWPTRVLAGRRRDGQAGRGLSARVRRCHPAGRARGRRRSRRRRPSRSSSPTAASASSSGRGMPAASARGAIRGLFTGGTLCDEARRIVGERPPHRFVDFGAEEYTRGRPHPIIDPSQRQRRDRRRRRRRERLRAAARSRARRLRPRRPRRRPCARRSPRRARAVAGRDLAIVAHVVGTDEDPQGLERQEEELRKLGVVVCASNRIAAVTARAIAEGRDGL